MFVRGNAFRRAWDLSNVQFSKFLKQIRSSALSSFQSGGLSHGLEWALAGKGIITKDKAFYNLEPLELQKEGAKAIEGLSGFPMFVRGNAFSGVSELSNAQFSKLLKQVTLHLSSVPKVFIQDGAIGSHSNCDAKLRIISDSPTAVLSLSSFLWKVPDRAISHDCSTLTVYIACSISSLAGSVIGLRSSSNDGFLAVDIRHSSLILCGKSFADTTGVRDALSALAAPVISARHGLPVHGRIIALDDSAILLFALGDTVRYCCNYDNAILSDAGVVLSSSGASPFFYTGNQAENTVRKPASVIIVVSDSSGVISPISKLSAGQAAYHFLAGYHDGKFFPTYNRIASRITPLQLARALYCHLEENDIQSFLMNVNHGGKHMEGETFVRLARATISDCTNISLLSTVDREVQDLKRKHESFFLGKFGTLPEGFYF